MSVAEFRDYDEISARPSKNPVSEHYMKTRTGEVVYFDHPTPDAIKFTDIAWALSNTTRFTGHTSLSVAQHTVEVGRFNMEEFERGDPERLEAGLVGVAHDFVETYIGDVSSPLKGVIAGNYRAIDKRFQEAIYARFGLTEARERHWDTTRKNDLRCLYEDAIRFRMDAVEFDPCYGIDTPAPRGWVPVEFESVLPAVIMTPMQAELALWRMFVSLMVESGRGALI